MTFTAARQAQSRRTYLCTSIPSADEPHLDAYQKCKTAPQHHHGNAVSSIANMADIPIDQPRRILPSPLILETCQQVNCTHVRTPTTHARTVYTHTHTPLHTPPNNPHPHTDTHPTLSSTHKHHSVSRLSTLTQTDPPPPNTYRPPRHLRGGGGGGNSRANKRRTTVWWGEGARGATICEKGGG